MRRPTAASEPPAPDANANLQADVPIPGHAGGFEDGAAHGSRRNLQIHKAASSTAPSPLQVRQGVEGATAVRCRRSGCRGEALAPG